MTTTCKAKPSAIEALKNKYPEATLGIEAANALHSGQMDEDQLPDTAPIRPQLRE